MDQPLLKHNYHLFLINTLLLIREVLAMSLGVKYSGPQKKACPPLSSKTYCLPNLKEWSDPSLSSTLYPSTLCLTVGLFWFHLDPAYKFCLGFQRPCPTEGSFLPTGSWVERLLWCATLPWGIPTIPSNLCLSYKLAQMLTNFPQIVGLFSMLRTYKPYSYPGLLLLVQNLVTQCLFSLAVLCSTTRVPSHSSAYWCIFISTASLSAPNQKSVGSQSSYSNTKNGDLIRGGSLTLTMTINMNLMYPNESHGLYCSGYRIPSIFK